MKAQYQFGAHKGISKVASSNNGKLWIARDYSLTEFIPDENHFTNFYGKNFTYVMLPKIWTGN